MSAARPEVDDMRSVHGVFRDTFGAAAQLVAEADGKARRAVIANFYENVISFLNAHHQSEEDLVFPLLRERCANDLALVDRIADQHTAVHDQIAASALAVADWNAGEDGAPDQCAAQLSKLGDVLVAHLDEEEEEVLPLCAAHLTVEEWGALPGHGMQLFQGDKIWLILGLIRQRMNDAQRAEMLEHLPPPVLDMWTGIGQRAFTDLMAEIGAPLG